MADNYRILGITPGAPLAEIKKAARALFMQYHPDLNHGNKQYFEDKTKEIIAAYKNLLEELRTESGQDTPPGGDDDSGSAGAVAPPEILVFRLAGRLFGLPTGCLREIIRLKDVSIEEAGMITGAFGFLEGVFHRDGRTALLLNLHAQLGLRGKPIGSDLGRAKIVVVELDDSPVGFIVDEIDGIMAAGEGEAGGAAPDVPEEYLAGRARTDAGPVLLLDMRKVIYNFPL